MAPRFGEDKVAEVRERASIAEVVSRYVALRRTGRNSMGLCPFHAEKTPSFSVSDERGFFHCFGCGESGDVFKFLMKVENLTFPEALERLARELGIELPRRPAEARRQEGRERLLELNARAAEYFRRCLWSERGAGAREYLRRRGIAEETARRFGLGYAPADGLARALEAAKVPHREAEMLGLIARSRGGGGWYDYFRDRLTFPITDPAGKVVAFGGRTLGDAKPKYLNSPESPVFQKRRALFGFFAARDAIRAEDRGIVVEGYLDAIALAQAGIRNVVAPLGTALTADQIRLLRRFTENITVLFDGDDAGTAAAARSFPAFAEVGVFAEAAFLPTGHDPDTFVREAGADGVREVVRAAVPLVDHYLRSLAAPDAPLAKRMHAAQAVAELIGRLRSPIFSGLLARRAAEFLGLPEEQLLRGVRPAAAAETRGAASGPPSNPPAPAKPPAAATLSPREALLFELLLVHPELRDSVPADAAGLLSGDEVRDLLRRVTAADADLAALLGELPRPLRDRITRALDAGGDAFNDPEAALRDCLARLEQERREARMRALRQAVREAEQRGDPETVHALLEEIQELGARARPAKEGD